MFDESLSLSFSAPDEDEAVPTPPACIYLVGRAGGELDRWRDAPELNEAVVVEPGSWSRSDFDDPGLVLFAVGDLSAGELLTALDFLARGRGEWLPVALEESEDGPVVRSLSLGYVHPLEEALTRIRVGPDGPVILELRDVIGRISTARHDINNPLTSGLAETQLLLMDITEGDAREGLETIQRQFRRVRDMVKELQPLRLKDS